MAKYGWIILLLISTLSPIYGWESVLLRQKMDGSLEYQPDPDGFILPDFSHAGYKGGGAILPILPSVKEITPIIGDNTLHIQTAINEVGKLPFDANGMRGALVLKAGTYVIHGTLYIPFDGVVLRGEGDATVLYAKGNTPHQRDVLIVGNEKNRVWGSTQIPYTKQYIQDSLILPGSCHLTLTDGSVYQIGDEVIIYHPCTQKWLARIDFGGVPYPDPSAATDPDERWEENAWPIIYHRYIRAVKGNQIELDAPLFYTLNKSLSESYLYKADMSGTVYRSGIENFKIEIETQAGVDENHAWQAVRFKSVENCWATHCTFVGFGQSGIITEACRRSTFSHCSAIDPVAIVTGERMYNFNTYLHSQLNLFEHCYARNGRHHYVSNGTSTTSGNVFLHCLSDGVQSVNEGHRSWTQAMLYDNHREINMRRDFVLGLYNRVAMGTGHGWAAVQSVLWNCDVDNNYGKIGLQQPPTSQNYAIGCHAKTITGQPIQASNFPKGFVEGQNQKGLEPQSLYLAQLKARQSSLSVAELSPFTTSFCWYDAPSHLLHLSDHIDRYMLYNLQGSLILSGIDSVVISTSHLPDGVYILKMQTGNYSTVYQKIII